MRVNSDFSQHALMLPTQYRWQTSPQAGVERVMLDRIGAEKARATSVVRYAPESTFPSHAHPGGEEIMVLSGTFSDESGDYPQGFYLRNPPGSSHAPKSKSGATIFVKLWQMCVTETTPVRINTDDPATWITQNNRIICPLYKNDNEVTKLVKLAPQQPLFDNINAHNALELFVLSGSVVHNEVEYSKGSWLRLPCNNKAVISAGNNSAKIYLKVGNFNNIGCGG
ncbi:anti-sigma factor [Pseudoalteromonas sp. S3178]|uniref:cupin domain-containing protein n=1 Tax=Pseudoalteromonas sp. S3178 TaxID=579532 RepID=UPI00110AC128|nr:cupin domain-containing protein [Pseudoalteromonas sp. S3178]TMP04428.1 anti-sigma factor [Pseudoalteromonas sp. S3178]|tara:strand:+ start:899 stop:1573 length:675 start_codon:yes stop_codon:yes gene_type:complete